MHGIYALVEPAAHAEPERFIDALLDGGIRLVQIRAKSGLRADELDALVARVRTRGGIVVVNDDIALAAHADGVHLGQDDLAGSDLRAVRVRLGRALLGVSCGTPAEARAAQRAGADYLGAGPIFGTPSKADAGPPIGVSGVRAVVESVAIPVAAIGGIDAARLRWVRDSGAAMAAVISALAGAADPAAAARALVERWNA